MKEQKLKRIQDVMEFYRQRGLNSERVNSLYRKLLNS